MNENGGRFPLLAASFYAWISAIFAGAAFLDAKYARALQQVLDKSDRSIVFSQVSDVLLLVGFVVVLGALAAIASSWRHPATRNLLIASLIVLSFELTIPVLLALSLQDAQAADIGPWLRILPTSIASVLAFIGLYQLYAGGSHGH